MKRQFVTMEHEAQEDSNDSGSEQSDAPAQGRKSLLNRQENSNKIQNQSNDENDDTKPMTRVPAIKNKQRVLLISSRGITYRFRHLLNDIGDLLPHSKKDSKFDVKSKLSTLNELAELSNCNNCIFFEVRKHSDLFMWMSKTPNGPSVKFHLQNIHTMDELKMTGNCLKGSRPLLSFDKNFDTLEHLQLLKEMFIQTFGTPKSSRKIKPFYDHVLSFTVADGRIWFRNYQIVEKKDEKSNIETSLVEIGPRFVMNVVRLFDGSFGGSTLYENPHYVSPNASRQMIKLQKQAQYKARVDASESRQEKNLSNQLPEDPLAAVFE